MFVFQPEDAYPMHLYVPEELTLNQQHLQDFGLQKEF